ncbi:MAG TPA: prepilin-type N-terminal cleavage/methylation domain-containing protein [Phycisphaerae bacterium]|nr:prepilin-type N-terminal cleavage/methylation domain-containing protein [Phycisphaerae bacterium]
MNIRGDHAEGARRDGPVASSRGPGRSFTRVEPPPARRRQGPGFTLVELLVVIAILALLMALLVPYLKRAKAIAVRVMCASNMRNIGTAGHGFAAEHGGRGPGGAVRGRPGVDPPWTGDSSVSWSNILNVEWFREDRIQRMGYEPQKNTLYCPSIRYWGSLYVRGHYWNGDAAGGPSGGSRPQGRYGLSLDPAPLSSMYAPFIYGSLNGYALGAKLERFRTPSELYLLLETEAGDDSFGAMTGPIRLNPKSTNPPPWVGGSGYGFAYRHVLPVDPTLYQAQATGNFLFLDAHVETHTPPDTINTIDRFVISP